MNYFEMFLEDSAVATNNIGSGNIATTPSPDKRMFKRNASDPDEGKDTAFDEVPETPEHELKDVK